MQVKVDFPPPHFQWPVLDERVLAAVTLQLGESVSIYDRSGIFQRFEDRFAAAHHRAHGLLFNSGTSALLAAYYAINIQPGDEVICADYGFFASVSPLCALQGVGVLCESDSTGGVCVDDARDSITERTRAIVVTHLWGVPANVEALRQLCDSRGIYLIEDCSHAHFAEFNGKKVGEFGHVAAWSLQAQKLVSAGEGGIALTDDMKLFERMLLLGHYNKRCRQQISSDSSNFAFATTGHGLKLRAQPLGIAMAEVDFERLPSRLVWKRHFANALHTKLKGHSDRLALPVLDLRNPAWYAYSFSLKCRNPSLARRILDDLHARGASDFDMPSSTTTISRYPLFKNWRLSKARAGVAPSDETSCGGLADQLAHTSIKVSVPWSESQAPLWNQYTSTLLDVLDRNLDRP
jgi:perosamine synthetase